jgi:hypothetical protein
MVEMNRERLHDDGRRNRRLILILSEDTPRTRRPDRCKADRAGLEKGAHENVTNKDFRRRRTRELPQDAADVDILVVERNFSILNTRMDDVYVWISLRRGLTGYAVVCFSTLLYRYNYGRIRRIDSTA